jgi:hypothetical protein
MRLSLWSAAMLPLAALALTTALDAGEFNRHGGHRATIGAGAHSDDITGSISGPARGDQLPLSDEERGHIFDGIIKLRAPVASVPPGATALPKSVPLQDLPASVTNDLPMVQGYTFVKLEDRILLVRPADRSVVAVMPRYKTVLD